MMALILPIGGAKQFLCSDITQGGRLNARTIKRNSGGRRCVEVRWRVYFHDSDFYSRFLALRLRKLLAAKKHKRQKEKSSICAFLWLLPTDDQLFGFLPNRKVRTDRTAI
jgi:hypothetical protein